MFIITILQGLVTQEIKDQQAYLLRNLQSIADARVSIKFPYPGWPGIKLHIAIALFPKGINMTWPDHLLCLVLQEIGRRVQLV